MNDIAHISVVFDEMLANIRYLKLITYHFKRKKK